MIPTWREPSAKAFAAAAAFKLMEIDDKQRLLKPGARVVDLGAAPGGWSQVAARRGGAAAGKGKVVAVDVLAMAPIAGVEFIQRDFLDTRAPDEIKALLGGPAEVVLSDMAANATGQPQDRSSQDYGVGGGGGRIRARGAGARRRVSLQGAARWHRDGAACCPSRRISPP
jgi:23S rRNA U2552 (ribose-2'-O)-methylase RlmE/FtsJ